MNRTVAEIINCFTRIISDWLDADSLTDAYMRQLASEADDIYDLEVAIKDWVVDQNPLNGNGNMFAESLEYVFELVRWLDIAEYYWQEDDEEGE